MYAYKCMEIYSHKNIDVCIHISFYNMCFYTYIHTCICISAYTYESHMHMYIHIYGCMHVCYMCMYVHTYMCHTGVVYNNISKMFMLWASSINNKVGLVQFANVYLKY